jgi:hypothetical protein
MFEQKDWTSLYDKGQATKFSMMTPPVPETPLAQALPSQFKPPADKDLKGFGVGDPDGLPRPKWNVDKGTRTE